MRPALAVSVALIALAAVAVLRVGPRTRAGAPRGRRGGMVGGRRLA
jgi:hypothetical protein